MEVVQVQNLGHDHPLMLIKAEETEAVWDLSCYGCEQPISILSSSSSSYYGCKRCTFFLHKSCAEIPHQMIHPCHPQHPLTLLPNPPSAGHYCDVCKKFKGHYCDVCTQYCNRFIYRCYDCNFDIDLKCALEVLGIQLSIDHPSHDPQLIPLQKESMFLCDACGTEHKGTSYLCTTCGFWINQKCAASPLTLKLNNHPHTLTLNYLVPQEEFHRHSHEEPKCQVCHRRNLELKCQICPLTIYRRNWAYYCSECNYLAHLHCAVSNETENQSHDLSLNPSNLSSSNSATATSDADQHKVIHLPVPDDSADIITQFIKNTAIQGKHEGAAEIKYGSHRHPLTLYEEPIDHASSHFDVAWNVQKCCGCAQSISAPFYCCVECEFYLHVWCAELPEELPHPAHPQHTLSLTTNRCAKCTCCNLFASTLLYECKECDFYLDCKCASLPRVIKHEGHDKHTLALRPTPFSGTCISCSASLTISFECGGCKFNLCVRCAILPRTVRHRYDKHPFTLTYTPLPYRTDDDFCEICEDGIDSNRWFYHCGECDQYLHTDCILPVDQFSNMVYNVWNPINSRKHPHRLIGVAAHPNTSCSRCKRTIAADNYYRCLPCKFCLCNFCAVSDAEYSALQLFSFLFLAILYFVDCINFCGFRVICLPVPDDSADIITQFIKNTAIQGKHEGAAEIKHGSHDHPLTLYEEPIDHASSHFNVAWNFQKCCGCAQTISAPFYCCLECEFYLHVWCAKLPEELRHPAHRRHALSLNTTHVVKCTCCSLIGNIFFYECEECDFYIDCKCASLPRVIEHESHDKHPLALRPAPFSSTTCKSCSASLRISFKCRGCEFNLCVRCAILPCTVQHRCDIHPLTLTYSPCPDRTDGDFCKICEEGIDSNRWFYHCEECDQYLHTDCILPVDQFSNMVYNDWKPINSRKHPHLLILGGPDPNTSCSLCKRSNADDLYLCPPCDFYLCDPCEEKEIEGEI
ncbi:hypothetical protein RHSIM_Rhsim03G0013000 [Rhododendron simsii]|uniref:Zinc finger PHD-type domain-containing protein n=1 Tax=Rhododendron simsii TaxID=118357 RepID=A0A834H5K8_RHOSS|nr:hypothetical protein RHSIM_Rhsim03G0013000 [Rhododendron simsii]